MGEGSLRNWFDIGGKDYARFRPQYPPRLAAALASLAPSADLAVDVGCGTGQLTTQLARLFHSVIGVDPSSDQISSATRRERVRYVCAPAELLPVEDHSTSLITVAQAAHWFDLPAFYREARRIAVPGAVLALISYGVPDLPEQLDERFRWFYRQEIGPYWPAQRALVDDGYRSIHFPFHEVTLDPISMEKQLTLAELLGYIGTWSAVRAIVEAGRRDILTTFATDLTALWGTPTTTLRVTWPINIRVGSLGHPRTESRPADSGSLATG